MEKECFFCDIQKENKTLYKNNSFYVRLDDFPVSKGHSTIVSKRHIALISELSKEEWLDLKDALEKTRELIKDKYNPDGINIGINEGKAAGQSIPHLHIHVIPRYNGDSPNPKGGIRNILKSGDYTKEAIEKGRGKYLD